MLKSHLTLYPALQLRAKIWVIPLFSSVTLSACSFICLIKSTIKLFPDLNCKCPNLRRLVPFFLAHFFRSQIPAIPPSHQSSTFSLPRNIFLSHKLGDILTFYFLLLWTSFPLSILITLYLNQPQLKINHIFSPFHVCIL